MYTLYEAIIFQKLSLIGNNLSSITILKNVFCSFLKGLSNGVFRLAIALIYNVSNLPRPSLLGWLQEYEASHAVRE